MRIKFETKTGKNGSTYFKATERFNNVKTYFTLFKDNKTGEWGLFTSRWDTLKRDYYSMDLGLSLVSLDEATGEAVLQGDTQPITSITVDSDLNMRLSRMEDSISRIEAKLDILIAASSTPTVKKHDVPF